MREKLSNVVRDIVEMKVNRDYVYERIAEAITDYDIESAIDSAVEQLLDTPCFEDWINEAALDIVADMFE